MKTMQAIMLSRLFVFLAMSGAGALGAAAQTRAIDVSGGRAVYAAMPHQAYLSAMTNMTAEAWINTTESTGPRFFFSKYASSNRTTGGEWYMGLEAGGMGMRVMIVPVGASGAASHRTFTLPYAYNDGKWHHVAFTYNESRIEAFYDGKSLGVNTSTTGPIRAKDVAVNAGVIFNGASPATAANSFIGLIGETRLWSTIRTEAEISANLHRRLRGDETGLVGYWPLNEAAGTEIYDRTSNANHGSIVGAVRTATDLAIGFILANPVTGSIQYMHEGTADVAEFSTHAGYTHFQITEGTTAPDPAEWELLANAPDSLSFTPPASGTPVTFTAWFTNTSASVTLLSDSATLIYTTTALPNAVAHASLSRLISPVPGSSLVITAAELDNGSTGGTYGSDVLGIVERRAILLEGPTANATPDETYVTVSGPGVYDLALVVRNETGNVATSDVCTVTVTTTSARYVVPAPGGSDANDGSSWGNAWATLEHAVAEAVAGELILISNGVHAVSGTLVLDKALTLMGFGDDPSETIVEPSSSRTNLVQLSHASARVENLTLRNGKTGANLLGAGTVSRCVVSGCDDSGVRLLNGGLVEHCVISNNTVNGSGAGAYLDGGGTVIRNCLVVDNRASLGAGCAGGVYFLNGSPVSEALAENCTIIGNFAIDNGGGVRVAGNDQGTLRNCIVHGNRALVYGDEVAGNIQVFNTILAPASVRGGVSIEADPRFADAANGDYRLLAGSPAIDAGETRPWMNGLARDLAGAYRLDGPSPDMGAYECQTVELDCAILPERRNAVLSDGAVGFTATVRGTQTEGLVYAWDFDGDDVTDLVGESHQTALHTYTAAGDYTVTLTVSNAQGRAASHVFADAVSVSPDVVYVRPGGGPSEAHPYASMETAAADIQAAIDVAVSGSVVRVAAGTYALEAPLQVVKGITLKGDAGAILDGQDATMCLYVEHPAAIVEGFTITRGLGSPVGGVDVYWAGTLRNCFIEDNGSAVGASSGAGGVRAQGGQSLVSHCVIRRNRGGSNLGGGGAVLTRGATLRNCLVTGNWTRIGTGWNGGGVMLLNAAFVDACTVVGNETFSSDGAGGVYSRQGIRSTMNNSIVFFNRHDAGLNPDVANGFMPESTNNIVGSLASVDILGAMTVDPEFRQNGTGYGETHQCGNYRPSYGSPTIDVGGFMDWMAGAVDLDGNERVVDGAVDIGAFEVQPPQATIIVLR